MGNLLGKTKSNWFAVKDNCEFIALIQACESDERIEVEQSDHCGEIIWSLSSNGLFHGLPNDCGEGKEDFMEALQPLIAKGHAAIITEIGFEGSRHVSGYVYVITEKEYQTANLMDSGVEIARLLLGDPGYSCINTFS